MLDLKSPISVVWEITNNCNFLCPHCRAYQKYEKEDEELENRIIEELIKSEVLLVNISGGEPLLNPRIFKIVKKLSDNNIHVGISTNVSSMINSFSMICLNSSINNARKTSAIAFLSLPLNRIKYSLNSSG